METVIHMPILNSWNKYFIADICLYCPTDVQWLSPDKGKYRQIFGTHPSDTPIRVIKSVYEVYRDPLTAPSRHEHSFACPHWVSCENYRHFRNFFTVKWSIFDRFFLLGLFLCSNPVDPNRTFLLSWSKLPPKTVFSEVNGKPTFSGSKNFPSPEIPKRSASNVFGILFANPEVMRWPRSDSPLHFDIGNI